MMFPEPAEVPFSGVAPGPSPATCTEAATDRNCDALVSWSALAEPADVGASWLVATLGAADALAWVREVAINPVAASMRLSEVAPPAQVDEALALSEKWVVRLDVAEPDVHRDHAARCGARVVTRGSPEWPPCLDDLGPMAPFALWVRGSGNLALLMARAVAIVGARSSTAYGEHVTATIASELCDRGASVVSGGAYGIDAAAHRTALAMAEPCVAVMAGGVDRLYPVGHADMLGRILDGGVIISEVPPGYAPHRARFLSRNRLIATARATVVVEAAIRSGALSTARHAAALVRPVGAVPGAVTSASSAGCHALIRDGIATLVTSGADVLDIALPVGASGAVTELDPESARAPELEFANAAQRQAFGGIGPRGASIEAVAKEAGLTLAQARAALGGLEMEGMITRDAGAWRRINTTKRPRNRT